MKRNKEKRISLNNVKLNPRESYSVEFRSEHELTQAIVPDQPTA